MAARVTKQFLQNVLQNAPKRAALTGAKGSKTGLLVGLAKSQQASAKKQLATQQQSKKVRGKKKNAAVLAKRKVNERFLDAAKKEQEHADRTSENVRKLKAKPNEKSQRLMAKSNKRRAREQTAHDDNRLNGAPISLGKSQATARGRESLNAILRF